MTDEDFDNGFIRARRNLILMSALILIYLSGTIALDEKGSFIGVPIKILDGKKVELWLLVFNIYFIWRYLANSSHLRTFAVFFIEIKNQIAERAEKKEGKIVEAMHKQAARENGLGTYRGLTPYDRKTTEKEPFFLISHKFDVREKHAAPYFKDSKVVGSNYISPISLILINIEGVIAAQIFRLTFTEQIFPLVIGVVTTFLFALTI